MFFYIYVLNTVFTLSKRLPFTPVIATKTVW